MKKETTRLVVNLPVELMNRVDQYADAMHVNRTSAVCFLLTQSLDNRQLSADLTRLLDAVQAQTPGE